MKLKFNIPTIKINKDKISKNAMIYLCAIAFFYVSSGAFSMLQGIYIKELKIGEDFLGLVISMKILATAVFSIPDAILVNKIGKKKGLFLAMFFVSFASIVQGYYTSKWIILIFASFQGAASSLMSVSEGPFFMENSTEKNRLALFSFSFADNVFSTMIGYYVFGRVTGALGNSFSVINALRYAIIISGCIGFISCGFICALKKNKNSSISQDNKKFIKNYINVVKQKYPSRFIIYNFIIGFGAGLVVPYFNVYLKVRINATTAQIGLIMALAQGAMGIGGLVTPFLAKKYGKIKTIIVCQLVSVPFLMLIAIPPSIYIVSTALFIRNALMNMTSPIIGNMTMELVEDYERSIFASINNISSSISRALSAIVAGYIMKNFSNGYEFPYFITAILYIIATVYFYEAFKGIGKRKAPRVATI